MTLVYIFCDWNIFESKFRIFFIYFQIYLYIPLQGLWCYYLRSYSCSILYSFVLRSVHCAVIESWSRTGDAIKDELNVWHRHGRPNLMDRWIYMFLYACMVAAVYSDERFPKRSSISLLLVRFVCNLASLSTRRARDYFYTFQSENIYMRIIVAGKSITNAHWRGL